MTIAQSAISPKAPGVDSRAADLVIEELAASEAILIERVADLEGDLAVYREVLIAAIDALRDLTRISDRRRAEHARLVDVYRGLREQILRDDEQRVAA